MPRAEGYTRSHGPQAPIPDSAETAMETLSQRAHDERPERAMVIVAHPDDADFGPAGNDCTLGRRGDRGPPGLLHQRRGGRRRPQRRSARACAASRGRAARGRPHRRLRGRDLPPSARWGPGKRPHRARTVGARHAPVPTRRRPDHRSASPALALGSRPAHRSPSCRHGRVGRDLSSQPEPDGLPPPGGRRGTPAACDSRAVPLLVRGAERLGRHERHRRPQDRRTARAREPGPEPEELDREIREWAAEQGRIIGTDAAEAFWFSRSES